MGISSRALRALSLIAVSSCLARPVAAEGVTPVDPQKNWGRHLAEIALANHPSVASLTIRATLPTGGEAAIVAPISAVSSASPATAGTIDEALEDVSGVAIGTLGVAFKTPSDADTTAGKAAATDIQSFFSKHLISAPNIVDRYPYSNFSPQNRAQALVDATMAKHPELLVLGMHVTLPDGSGNVILGSNIGRIGKKADDDDMRVITTGKPSLEIAENKKRYEVELVLEDARGTNIGALGVVFAYHPGLDTEPLARAASAIRDEMAAKIASAAAIVAENALPLTLAGVTPLPGYRGDFDHFAVDAAHQHLFLAGEDGAKLEVFDLATGAFVRGIAGFGVPHSMLVMPARNELLVIDGSKPSVVFDTATLARKRTIALPAGADSADFDASTGHLWIVTGGKDVPQADSNLIEIDPVTGKRFNTVHFDANHVEALAVEQHGNRLFINVTDKNQLAVVDKMTGKIVATWPVTVAKQNACIALDETTDRLFIVTRAPGELLVLDATSGDTVATFKAPERTDQALWDPVHRRVYATGGEGYIGVYQQLDADHYAASRVPSRAGAKTAIFVPSLDRLYVAASPGDTAVGGAVLRYDVAANSI